TTIRSHSELGTHALVTPRDRVVPWQNGSFAMEVEVTSLVDTSVSSVGENLLPPTFIVLEPSFFGCAGCRDPTTWMLQAPRGFPEYVNPSRLVDPVVNVRAFFRQNCDSKEVIFQSHSPVVAVNRVLR